MASHPKLSKTNKINDNAAPPGTWTNVGIDFGDEETVNFGVRDEFVAADALYQLQTVAVVCSDNSDTTMQQGLAECAPCHTHAVCNSKYIALGLDCDLTLLLVNPYELARVIIFDYSIVSMCWLAASGNESSILAVVTDDLKLSLLDVESGELMHKQEICVRDCSVESVLLDAVVCENSLVLYVLLNNSLLTQFTTPDYNAWLHALQAKEDAELDRKQRMLSEAEQINYLLCDTDGKWTTMLHRKDRSFCSTIHSEMMEAGDEHRPHLLYSEVPESVWCSVPLRSVQMLCDGLHCVSVDVEGVLCVWQRAVWLPIYQLQVSAMRILDCQLLDTQHNERELVPLAQSRVFLLLEDEQGQSHVHIRSLDRAFSVQYTIKLTGSCALTRGHCLHEPTLIESDLQGQVRVRSIVEAHPTVRLTRLLAKCKFEEAAIFAKQMKLDLQLVYRTELNHVLSRLEQLCAASADVSVPVMCSTAVQQCVGRVRACLEQCTDYECVATVCEGLARAVPDVAVLTALFAQADQLMQTPTSSSEQALKQIEQCRQRVRAQQLLLTTSHMLYSAYNARVMALYSTGDWLALLQTLIRDDSNNQRAVVFWCRHEPMLLAQLNASQRHWAGVLGTLRHKCIDSYGQVRWSVEEMCGLLEPYILPAALLRTGHAHLQTVADTLADWLIGLCNQLDLSRDKLFPDNALHLATCLRRTVEHWFSAQVHSAPTVTPKQQARAQLAVNALQVDSYSADTATGRLNRLCGKLRLLQRLYKVYKCEMSLADFSTESCHSICHLLLDRVNNVDVLPEAIEQVAVPYMNEHNLQSDSTLHAYMLVASCSLVLCSDSSCLWSYHVIGMAESSGDAEGGVCLWLDRCLAVLGCVQDVQLRCAAVCALATHAPLPWSQALHTVIQHTLTINLPCVADLRRACATSELRGLMAEYCIPAGLLSDCNSDANAQSRMAVRKLLAHIIKDGHKMQSDVLCRLVHVQRVAELCELHMDKDHVLLDMLKVLMRSDKTSDVLLVMGSVSAEDSVCVLDHLVCWVQVQLQSPGLDKHTRTWLLHNILAVLNRHCASHSPHSNTLEAFRSMNKLWLDYGRACSLQQFGHVQWRLDLFERTVQSSANVDGQGLHGLQHSECINWMCDLRRLACVLQLPCSGALLSLAAVCVQHSRLLLALKLIQEWQHLVGVSECAVSEQHRAHGLLELVCEAVHEHAAVTEHVQLLSALSKAFTALLASVSSMQHALTLAKSVRLLRVLCSVVQTDTDSERVVLGSPRMHHVEYTDDLRMGALLLDKERVLPLVTVCVSHMQSNTLLQHLHTLMNTLHMHEHVYSQLQLLMLVLQCDYEKQLVDWQREQSTVAFQLLDRMVASSSCHDPWLMLCCLLVLSSKQIRSAVGTLQAKYSNRPRALFTMNAVVYAAGRQRIVPAHNPAHAKMLLALSDVQKSHSLNSWAHLIQKVNVKLPAMVDRLYNSETEQLNTVTQMAQGRVPVSVVKAFCTSFQVDVRECLLVYMHCLLCATDHDEHTVPLCRAAMTDLQGLKGKTATCERLYAMLRTVDPYDYELIGFLLHCLELMPERAVAALNVDLLRLRELFNSLVLYERTSCNVHVTERKFYVEHKQLAQASSVIVSPITSDLLEESSAGPGAVFGAGQPIVPHEWASHRLPWHVFVPDTQADGVMLSVVHRELTQHNIKHWLAFAQQVALIPLCPDQLVDNVVANIVNTRTAVTKGLLDTEVLLSIKHLLMDAPAATAIKCCPWIIKQLNLGECKIEALLMAIEVADAHMLKLDELDAQYALCAKFRASLVRARQSIGTEWALRSHDLLNADTRPLLASPARLICYLCQHALQPDSLKSTNNVTKAMKEIANLHEQFDLLKVLKHLIEQLIATREDTQAADDTMLLSSQSTGNACMTVLPLFDERVSRFVTDWHWALFVLKQMELADACRYLVHIINQSEQEGNEQQAWPRMYERQLRAVCCLVRLVDNEQLRAYFPATCMSALCASAVPMLYVQWLVTCHMPYTLHSLQQADMRALVCAAANKVHVGPGSNLSAHVAACVLIDYSIHDSALIGQVLTALLTQRPSSIVAQLLLTCQQDRALWLVVNLHLFWIRHVTKQSLDQATQQQHDRALAFLARCVSVHAQVGTAVDQLTQASASLGQMMRNLHCAPAKLP